jgi:hypothetical protein
VAVVGFSLAFGPCGQLGIGSPFFFFKQPLLGQLSLDGESISFELRLPPQTVDESIRVTLDGEAVDLSGAVVTDSVLTADLGTFAEGWHLLRASVDVEIPSIAIFTLNTFTSFEIVGLENPDECEVLNGAECLLPYPSSRFLEPAATATGYRLAIPQTGMPAPNGPAVLPDPLNELDGFSPTVQILMNFPTGVDLELSDAPRLLDPECCGQPAGPPWIDTRTHTDRSLDPGSPSVLIDVETGERVLHFLELDAGATDPARQILFLRPGESLVPGHRYVVAIRGLVGEDGEPVRPEPAFAVIRDRRPTTIPAVEERRQRFEEDIQPVLRQAGVARHELQLAFDFIVQSEDQLTRQMLAMRDQAFDWLADREAEQIASDAAPPTFTVDSVEELDCSAPGAVTGRIVRGTYQSPLFLDGDLLNNTVQLMNVDADDIPVQNGVTNPDYTISIPCAVFDGTGDVARPLVLGHGLFGRGDGLVVQIPELAGAVLGEFNFISGATDWRGLSGQDLFWVAGQILGIGTNQLNNFPALPDRLRQGMLNTLVLGRMMKRGLFNSDPAFQVAGEGVFPGPAEEMYYYGISLGGIMGTWYAALMPDIERYGVDVPAINFSFLLQRSTQFEAFEAIFDGIGLTDPMEVALGLQLLHELWVSAEPAGYARHVTRDPLPGSGDPAKLFMTVAWLDKQVSNQASEVAARTLGLPNLTSSIAQGLVGIPDVDTGVSGPQDSAMVIWDTGSFDILDPAQEPFIPALANEIPSGVCDPHGFRPTIPASVEMLVNFLQPGGQIESLCDGLCDATDPGEKPFTITPACDPFVPPAP